MTTPNEGALLTLTTIKLTKYITILSQTSFLVCFTLVSGRGKSRVRDKRCNKLRPWPANGVISAQWHMTRTRHSGYS